MCDICNKYYKSNKTLLNHQTSYHTKNNKADEPAIKYQCKYCNFEFRARQNKTRHERNCTKNINKQSKLINTSEEFDDNTFMKSFMTNTMETQQHTPTKTTGRINNNNINIIVIGEENKKKILDYETLNYIIDYINLKTQSKNMHINLGNDTYFFDYEDKSFELINK